MYLKQAKQSNGRIYLSLVQGYRKEGKPKTRTIESLGYLDELEKKYDDPIAYFKALCDERNAEANALRAPVSFTLYPEQKIDKRTTNRKNLGVAIPLAHYNLLGIEKALRNSVRNAKHSFDINAIMRLLVMERIIAPGSKLSAVHNRDNYFFKSDFTEDDVYRALDIFAQAKKRIVSAMNRSIDTQGKRNLSHVFYDVTNHYFEIDEEDKLRRRGVEKNRRPDPIVQMGLLQDANAIPLNYEIFPGNTNDCVTLLPVIKDLKEQFSLERVIMVADKGLNTSDNIAAATLDKNGFVFSQSIRGTKSKKELREWVISDEGYRANEEDTFKIKSRQDMKTIHVEGSDGKPKHIDVDVKIVAYWSAKYAARARHKRAESIEKAKRLIADPTAFTKATSYGAAKYVENISFDKKTGEVIEDTGKHATLNEETIAQEEACDGFYCIITSETHLPDQEIIDIYKGLWRIEEAFRISKTDLSARPVYVQTPAHIEAHFLTCYIALTIMRLIQFDTNFKYSAAAIIKEISSIAGTHLQDNWWLFDHRSDLSDALCESIGIDLSKRNMQLSEIKSILTSVNRKSQDKIK
jgi:transposase